MLFAEYVMGLWACHATGLVIGCIRLPPFYHQITDGYYLDKVSADSKDQVQLPSDFVQRADEG